MYKMDEDWKYKTKDWVRAVALSEDGEGIALGSSDLNIYYFNKNGELIWKKEVESKIMCCEFSGDGNFLIVGLQAGSILLFDKKGRIIWGHYAKNSITTVSITSKGEYITVGSEDKYIYFFKNDGKLLWKYQTGDAVSSVNLSSNGDFIVASSHDDNIYYFRKNGVLLWKYKLDSWVNSTNISEDGDYIVAGSQKNKLCFFNKSGELLWFYKTHDPIQIVKISANGEYIVACNGNFIDFFDKQRRRIWNYEFSEKIKAASFSKNGKFLVVGSRNNNFYLFINNGELLWSYPTKGTVNAIDISSDGEVVLAGSDDCYAYFFNLNEFYKSFILTAEKTVRNAYDFGVDITDIETLLIESKKLFDQKRFEESRDRAIQAKNNAEFKQKISKPEIHVKICELDKVKHGEWNHLKINLENKGSAHAKRVSMRISGPMKVKDLIQNFELKVGQKKELRPLIRLTIDVSHFNLRSSGIYYDVKGRQYTFRSAVDIKSDKEEKKETGIIKEEKGETSYFKYKYVTKKKAELKICPFCTARFKKGLAVEENGKLKCPKCGAGLR